MNERGKTDKEEINETGKEKIDNKEKGEERKIRKQGNK